MKPLFTLSALFVSASLITSCSSTKNGEYSEYASSDDPYASTAYQPYGTDGGEIPQYEQYTPPQESYTPEPAFTTPEPSYTPPKPASKPNRKPSSSSRPKSKPSKSSKSYTVKRGDTLYGVSRKQGSSVAAIKKANGLRSDLIRVGQVLVIP